MESKLLCGGKDIVDHTNEQQRVLDQKRREIIEEQVSHNSFNQMKIIINNVIC